ncbi:MAG: hypothetical protein LKG27_03970, partial [Clostridiaceae bacterium]|nr:hypothetical protein [Clostridiaceae bacterium]
MNENTEYYKFLQDLDEYYIDVYTYVIEVQKRFANGDFEPIFAQVRAIIELIVSSVDKKELSIRLEKNKENSIIVEKAIRIIWGEYYKNKTRFYNEVLFNRIYNTYKVCNIYLHDKKSIQGFTIQHWKKDAEEALYTLDDLCKWLYNNYVGNNKHKLPQYTLPNLDRIETVVPSKVENTEYEDLKIKYNQLYNENISNIKKYRELKTKIEKNTIEQYKKNNKDTDIIILKGKNDELLTQNHECNKEIAELQEKIQKYEEYIKRYQDESYALNARYKSLKRENLELKMCKMKHETNNTLNNEARLNAKP